MVRCYLSYLTCFQGLLFGSKEETKQNLIFHLISLSLFLLLTNYYIYSGEESQRSLIISILFHSPSHLSTWYDHLSHLLSQQNQNQKNHENDDRMINQPSTSSTTIITKRSEKEIQLRKLKENEEKQVLF